MPIDTTLEPVPRLWIEKRLLELLMSFTVTVSSSSLGPIPSNVPPGRANAMPIRLSAPSPRAVRVPLSPPPANQDPLLVTPAAAVCVNVALGPATPVGCDKLMRTKFNPVVGSGRGSPGSGASGDGIQLT